MLFLPGLMRVALNAGKAGCEACLNPRHREGGSDLRSVALCEICFGVISLSFLNANLVVNHFALSLLARLLLRGGLASAAISLPVGAETWHLTVWRSREENRLCCPVSQAGRCATSVPWPPHIPSAHIAMACP